MSVHKKMPPPMPGLLDLPADMVRHILGMLGTRSRLRAAATCRALRDMTAVMPLRPTMTSQTPRMMRWLERPAVAPRVVALTARNCLWGRCAFLSRLTHLTHLTVTFGSVSAPISSRLPPLLEHLDLHRLDCEYGDVFDVARLAHLTRLRTLKLSFTPKWAAVLVAGLAPLSRLEHLTVRQAPTMMVQCPVAAREVRLHATDTLLCPYEVTGEDVSIECEGSRVALDVMLTPEAVAGVRRLFLAAPGRATVPSLEHMPRLESLRLRFDSALLPLRHLAAMPGLRQVEVEARYGVAVSGATVKLPRAVAVAVLVGGVPTHRRTIDALFYGTDGADESARESGGARAVQGP